MTEYAWRYGYPGDIEESTVEEVEEAPSVHHRQRLVERDRGPQRVRTVLAAQEKPDVGPFHGGSGPGFRQTARHRSSGNHDRSHPGGPILIAEQRAMDPDDGRGARDRFQAPGAYTADKPLGLAALLLGRLAVWTRCLPSPARRVGAQTLLQRLGTPDPAHNHHEMGPGFEVRGPGLRHDAEQGVVVDQNLGEVLTRRRGFGELEWDDTAIGAAANPRETPRAAIERRAIVFAPLARCSWAWSLWRFHISICTDVNVNVNAKKTPDRRSVPPTRRVTPPGVQWWP